jgi:hypothetical protein
LFVTTFKIILYALCWSSLSLSSTLSASVVNEWWSLTSSFWTDRFPPWTRKT